MKKRTMTEKEDKAMDKRMGLKEGSKRDLAKDKKMGVKESGRRTVKKT